MGYPHDNAGWKGNKPTGIQSAFYVTKDLGRRQAEVMTAFAPFGAAGATCDAIAEILGISVFHVRPRASELEAKGKLFPVGTAKGVFGRNVTVYSTVKPDELELQAAA